MYELHVSVRYVGSESWGREQRADHEAETLLYGPPRFLPTSRLRRFRSVSEARLAPSC